MLITINIKKMKVSIFDIQLSGDLETYNIEVCFS